jgi:hypothetical protein
MTALAPGGWRANTFAVIISSHISGSNKYLGGVLASNGHIYMMPNSADNIGDFDPSTNKFAVIDISTHISSTVTCKYRGGALASNGHIYMVPSDADKIGDFDPSTNMFTMIDVSVHISGTSKFLGGFQLPSGIYFSPLGSGKVGKLELGNREPSYQVEGNVPEAWKPLLSLLSTIL